MFDSDFSPKRCPITKLEEVYIFLVPSASYPLISAIGVSLNACELDRLNADEHVIMEGDTCC